MIIAHSPIVVSEILTPAIDPAMFHVPFYASTVQAGFSCPAEDDLIERAIDLNDHLIKNKTSTFLVRVSGHSMKDAGILDGDMLVVDRSLTPKSGQIVVAILNGDLTVKRFKEESGEVMLEANNPHYPSLSLKKEDELVVWGVVTSVIHKF